MKAQASKLQAPPVSFETALQELESLVQTLENGGTPLEDSLQAYERGVALLKHCQEILGAAEQKIRILDNGQLTDFNTAAAGGSED